MNVEQFINFSEKNCRKALIVLPIFYSLHSVHTFKTAT